MSASGEDGETLNSQPPSFPLLLTASNSPSGGPRLPGPLQASPAHRPRLQLGRVAGRRGGLALLPGLVPPPGRSAVGWACGRAASSAESRGRRASMPSSACPTSAAAQSTNSQGPARLPCAPRRGPHRPGHTLPGMRLPRASIQRRRPSGGAAAERAGHAAGRRLRQPPLPRRQLPHGRGARPALCVAGCQRGGRGAGGRHAAAGAAAGRPPRGALVPGVPLGERARTGSRLLHCWCACQLCRPRLSSPSPEGPAMLLPCSNRPSPSPASPQTQTTI